MSLLEFASMTVPDVVKKAVPGFFYNDPLMKRIQTLGNVKRMGGTNVRFRRIKSGHSDVSEISATNMSVPLNKRETFDTMTGDWARFIKPFILTHLDHTRLQSAADKKRFVQDTTFAAMQSLKNDVSKRIYIGNQTGAQNLLYGLGTLNGGINTAPNSTGTASGLGNGALMFATPAQQAAAATTYLNLARKNDTVSDLDNWYNQYKAHNGIGTDFIDTVEELKILADSYSDSDEGVEFGILSVADLVALGKELRAYPGGANASAMMYRPEDIEKGLAHKTIYVVNGVTYYANRWITAAGLGDYPSGAAIPEAAYLINPKYYEWWVNAGEDFRVSKFTDHLEHGNQDADVGYIFLECQSVLPGLMMHACTSNPA